MNEEKQSPLSINALVMEANVVKPGDVVVLSYASPLSAVQRKAIRETLDRVCEGSDVKFLITDGGAQVTVVRNGESAE